QQFYKKPSTLGGGNNTFAGFTIPTNLAATANGTYTAVVAAQSVVITGTGVVTNAAGKKYVAETTVAPATITTAVPTLQ
ncbi:MAG: hypothetical protein Q8M94_22820, partial [Ignavibacteria bacterium]|nr:hypothetical protein [Ignavibacteria bacterium]